MAHPTDTEGVPPETLPPGGARRPHTPGAFPQARSEAVTLRPGGRPPRPGEYLAVIFDLDGTLTREANSWAAVQRRLGTREYGRARDRWRRYAAGGLTRTAFLEEQVGDLAGQASTLLDAVVAEVEYQDGVAVTCATLRAAGLRLAIVSAGLAALAERVAGDLGIELHRANTIEVADGLFTGRGTIAVPPGGKAPVFLETCAALGVEPRAVVAVGDSSGDIDMFELAGLGVAFDPASQLAREAADAVIEQPDMRHLLELVLPPASGG